MPEPNLSFSPKSRANDEISRQTIFGTNIIISALCKHIQVPAFTTAFHINRTIKSYRFRVQTTYLHWQFIQRLGNVSLYHMPGRHCRYIDCSVVRSNQVVATVVHLQINKIKHIKCIQNSCSCSSLSQIKQLNNLTIRYILTKQGWYVFKMHVSMLQDSDTKFQANKCIIISCK